MTTETKKIEKLTDEQMARIPEFVEKWTKIGLAVGASDRPRAEKAIDMMYKQASLDVRSIVWCDSPLEQGIARSMLVHLSKSPETLDEMFDAIQLAYNNLPALIANPPPPKEPSSTIKYASIIAKCLWHRVEECLLDGKPAGTQISEAGKAILQRLLVERLDDLTKVMEKESLVDAVRASVNESAYGQHDASWLAFYDYFKEVCGLVEQTKVLEGLWELAKSSGWILPMRGVCLASERPSLLKTNEAGRLHCDNGPAIAFPDGWALYFWHGTQVTQPDIEQPETLTVERIDKETNAEVRRALIEIKTPSAYLWEAKAELVDVDVEKCRKGAAPRALLKDGHGNKWLVGTDGSTERTYYMPVPEGVTNCAEAHKAICGFDESRILAKS